MHLFNLSYFNAETQLGSPGGDDGDGGVFGQSQPFPWTLRQELEETQGAQRPQKELEEEGPQGAQEGPQET